MDKALKQRLVGASVIIALAVIVLPMLLSGRPEDLNRESKKIELPPRPDELSFETRRFPVMEDEDSSRRGGEEEASPTERQLPVAASPDGPDVSIPSRDKEPTHGEPPPGAPDLASHAVEVERETAQEAELPAPENAGPAPKESPATPTAGAGAASTPESGRYVVQVASLGSAENASRLMKSLQQQGFPVLMDTVESDVGHLNRVRVGPYGTEALASQASAKIGRDIEGVAPRVVDLQPERAAPVTNPADPLVRWVVQLGSFGEEANANRLVKQLQDDGLAAYQEKISSASSVIYRVRVGPYLEREEALGVRTQVADKFSIEGVVMSAN